MAESVPSYEEWERYCFTQGQADFAESIHDEVADARLERFTVLPNATLVEYVDRLFSTPATLADRYTKRQLADGVCFTFGSGSELVREYFDDVVAESDLVRRLDRVGVVYEQLFDPVSAPTSKTAEGPNSEGQHALNGAIFMIWDLDNGIDRFLRLGSPVTLDAAYSVIDRILACRSIACHMSAIHALGHAVQSQHREKAVQRIDAFLARPDLSDDMLKYAQRARDGQVQ